MAALTPWAHKSLTFDDRMAILHDAPQGSTVDLGRSRGWTCRIRVGNRLLAEAYHAPSPMAAFRAALEKIA